MNETIVKHLNFGEDAKNKVFTGIDKLTKAVSSTLGAGGKCVIMEGNDGKPIITKDGVTVADSITLLDPVENMGARLIKEAARKTVKEAGDGTTTATVLAHAILQEAYGAIKSESPRKVRDGIQDAVDHVIRYLDKSSSKVTGNKIQQVATISANNDNKLGDVIAEAFNLVDETGIVMMETHEQPETIVELIEGVKYNRELKNNHFITNKEKGTAELENPLVLVVESKIENIRKIQNVLEYVIKNNKSLLIIADVDPQVVSALAMNKIKGNIKVNIIDAPIYGLGRKDVLSDLCDVTEATLINEDLGDDMDLISVEHLGSCTKAITNHEQTILQVNLEENDRVKETVGFLKQQVEDSKNNAIKARLEKRLGNLNAKMAIIKVGANSEVELKEKQDRVEDAICATKAAIKEGIVPGGGVALLNAANNVKAKSTGEQVLLNACCVPFTTILKNAGIDDVSLPTSNGKGINVVTGKTVSMVKSGIIDPLLVTKSALKNAASVATTILYTDCVINNLRA